jgi:hypothetical protein
MNATKTNTVLVDVYLRSSVTLEVPAGTSPAEVRRLAMLEFLGMAKAYDTTVAGELSNMTPLPSGTMDMEEENWRSPE